MYSKARKQIFYQKKRIQNFMIRIYNLDEKDISVRKFDVFIKIIRIILYSNCLINDE